MRSSPFITRSVLSATLFVLALLPEDGHAQVVLLHEDFSAPGFNFIPLGWSRSFVGIPSDWYMGFPSTNSCMPVTNSRALIFDDELWAAGNCGVTNGGAMWTPVLAPPAGMDVRIRFDYFLDIDSAGGDSARVSFYSAMLGSPPGASVATDTTNLLQTGTWQSLDVLMPASSFQQFLQPPWVGFQVNFDLRRNSTQPRAGWAIDNVHVEYGSPSTIRTHCAQDFSMGGNPSLPCPCQNFGLTGTGCANSLGSSGARLDAAGFDSAGLDDLTLMAGGMAPGKPALLVLGGSTITPWASGSGVSCLGAPLVPLGVRFADSSGQASWGGSGFLSSHGWGVGTQLHLQVQYRDVQPAHWNCNPGGPDDFNWTPLVSLTVAP